MPNPPVRQRYSEHFNRTYATGAVGGFDGYDFTVTFFRDNIRYPEELGESPNLEREFLSEVALPLASLKEITRWLLQNVNAIEEENGVIKEPLIKAETKKGEVAEPKGKILAPYS